VCGFVAAFVFAAPSRGASPVSGPASSDAIKHGDEIFHQRCILCHNQQPGDSLPFGPPNLYQAFRGKSPMTSHQAETIIAQGKGPMPAFGTILTKSDIRSVVAYLRTR
jgi:mono/diheme cytochrome c family protein